MNSLLSWLDLIIKLFLLGIFGVGAWSLFHSFRQRVLVSPIAIATLSPFFITYKIAAAAGQGGSLDTIYLILAGSLLILLGLFYIYNFSKINQIFQQDFTSLKEHRLLLWCGAGIILFLWIRGLYLEYPGDAVIYLQRIGLANQDAPANISSLWQYQPADTFTNSFQHWLVGTDALMREKLGLVAALSAGMLCFATYRLSLWCTPSQPIAVLSVLLFLGFYGNLQISFFLYKILQGATLALIAYLEILPSYWDSLTQSTLKHFRHPSKIAKFLIVITGVWICLDCHQEKILYLIAITFSYIFFSILKNCLQRKPLAFLAITAFSLITVLLLWLSLSDRPPVSINSPSIHFWATVGESPLFIYWPNQPNSSFMLLDMMCMVLAVLILSQTSVSSKLFFMGTIAIAPIFFFINPVAVTALIKLTHPNNLYRIMIGGLPWIFLPLVCHFLYRQQRLKIQFFPIVFVALGFLAYSPVYGKFSHLLRPIPPYADGRDLSPVVEQLLETSYQHGDRPLNILAPPYVNTYLAAWPQFTLQSNRWLDDNFETRGPDLAYFFGTVINDIELAEMLAPNFDTIVLDRRDWLSYQSWLGEVTKHWAPDLIQTQRALFAGNNLRNYLENTSDPNFKKTLEVNSFEVYQKIIP
ncbi:MAG: hypothetical protein AAF722_00630 [Cyanobacteria bacterium P01_C01_bin.70]